MPQGTSGRVRGRGGEGGGRGERGGRGGEKEGGEEGGEGLEFRVWVSVRQDTIAAEKFSLGGSVRLPKLPGLHQR